MDRSMLRMIILQTMGARGVAQEQIDNAKSIRFPKTLKLLGSSLKVEKGSKKKVLTAVLYLAPHKASVPFGGKNVCPFATTGCVAACLGHSSGRLAMSTSQNAQIWKTLAFFHARKWFVARLQKEISLHARKALKKGYIPAVRLDGSSDLGLARYFAPYFPQVQFYDYTKSAQRASQPDTSTNIHYTFSLAETVESYDAATRLAERKGNVAVVFRTKNPEDFPDTWQGLPVINGDETDVRFMDPKGCCVGLTVKGNKAPKDTTGFVQEVK